MTKKNNLINCRLCAIYSIYSGLSLSIFGLNIAPFAQFFRSIFTGVNFLKIVLNYCAWRPNFLTAFTAEEVERQKMFL